MRPPSLESAKKLVRPSQSAPSDSTGLILGGDLESRTKGRTTGTTQGRASRRGVHTILSPAEREVTELVCFREKDGAKAERSQALGKVLVMLVMSPSAARLRGADPMT